MIQIEIHMNFQVPEGINAVTFISALLKHFKNTIDLALIIQIISI